MRRIPTAMMSAGAAALTTLAVAVAVPAIGDDASGPPKADPFAACLRDHGLDGAPDGAGLKPWLGRRFNGDGTAERALEACSPHTIVKAGPGPSVEELRSCLKDHGVAVPGDDPAALKRWIGEHHEDAATADALKACDVMPADDKAEQVTCVKAGPFPAPGTPEPAKPEAGSAASDARGAGTGTGTGGT